MSAHELEPVAEHAEPAGLQTPVAPTSAGLRGMAGAIGNRAFATAAIARRPATGAAVARDPLGDDAPPPVSPEVKALADQIATELGAVDDEIRDEPPPTLEHLRTLRNRVQVARALFDTDRPAGATEAGNWGSAMVQAVFARTLLDGLVAPGSDLPLRLSWGKAFGTCRQLIPLLRAAEAAEPAAEPAPSFTPAPSPNPLPPPPPPPIGAPVETAPAPALSPGDAMEFEICPRIELAIGEIGLLITAATVPDIEAMRDRYEDIPQRIFDVAGGQEFGPIAALEFQKGLELVNQATLAEPDQLENVAKKLDAAVDRVTNLDRESSGGGDEPAPAPAFTPAPSPNPLPPPPPPPIQP